MAHSTFRIHEPYAVAALAAAGISLHLLWIGNLLAARLQPVAHVMNIWPVFGPVSGLYALALIGYLLTFLIVALVCRGRDCTRVRDAAFWFFVSALAAFAVLAIPFMAGFGIVAQTR